MLSVRFIFRDAYKYLPLSRNISISLSRCRIHYNMKLKNKKLHRFAWNGIILYLRQDFEWKFEFSSKKIFSWFSIRDIDSFHSIMKRKNKRRPKRSNFAVVRYPNLWTKLRLKLRLLLNKSFLVNEISKRKTDTPEKCFILTGDRSLTFNHDLPDDYSTWLLHVIIPFPFILCAK